MSRPRCTSCFRPLAEFHFCQSESGKRRFASEHGVRRTRSHVIGRPKAFTDAQLDQAAALRAGGQSWREVATEMQIDDHIKLASAVRWRVYERKVA